MAPSWPRACPPTFRATRRSSKPTSGADRMALLEVEGLVGGYRADLDILHGVTLRVEEGQMVSIIGPNGAGKSTVLRAIFGIVRLKRGNVRLSGRDVTALSPQQRL